MRFVLSFDHLEGQILLDPDHSDFGPQGDLFFGHGPPQFAMDENLAFRGKVRPGCADLAHKPFRSGLNLAAKGPGGGIC